MRKRVLANLTLVLALVLALSPMCGASGWVNASGSICHACSSAHAPRPPVDPCCAPVSLAPAADDCRACCKATRSTRTPEQLPTPLAPAIVPEQARVTFSGAAETRIVKALQHFIRRAALRSPPTLRGPPA